MSFTPAWLALREPADRSARASVVTQSVVRALGQSGDPAIVDLGAGSGSNLRYLAPLLGAGQRWRLVDHDASLLARAEEDARSRGLAVETVAVDLASLEESVIPDGTALVTASAFLDLVSDAWLTRLADLCARRDAVVLFALTYDGRVECTPADRDDAEVVALVNAHQRTDKGFGPGLGPAAAGRTRECLLVRGYEVVAARSDWLLGPGEAALQRELIAGWARAAVEQDPARTAMTAAWRERRLAHVGAGASRLIVGHEDVGGWKAPRN